MKSWPLPLVEFYLSDTLASSHLLKTSLAAGAAASLAESHKRTKYTELSIAHTFTPVAIETLGSWGPDATLLISELDRRIALVTREPRSASVLRQRIDVVMQRGNAAAILGTIPTASDS